MKKVVYISSIAFLMLATVACQKTELQTLGVDESQEIVTDRRADDSSIDKNDQHFNSQSRFDRDGDKEIDIMVKEVSDGDEESDDDENKSSN